MAQPICVPCERTYRCKKNGIGFIEGAPRGMVHVPSGKEFADQWGPYKLWAGDLWECPGCGHEIIVGQGRSPISEHYKDDFADQVKGCDAKLLVKG